jgi:hypothetical protein
MYGASISIIVCFSIVASLFYMATKEVTDEASTSAFVWRTLLFAVFVCSVSILLVTVIALGIKIGLAG